MEDDRASGVVDDRLRNWVAGSAREHDLQMGRVLRRAQRRRRRADEEDPAGARGVFPHQREQRVRRCLTKAPIMVERVREWQAGILARERLQPACRCGSEEPPNVRTPEWRRPGMP